MIRATRRMLDYFESKKMKWLSDIDTTKQGKDVVTVVYNCDNIDKIRFKIFVDPDEDNVAIRVWSIAKANGAAKAAAMQLVMNELNSSYRWYRFYLDEDSEVTAAVDCVITPDTIGPVVYELVQRGCNIIDEGYPKMMQALWGGK
ncbi:MAG: hypothetical protein IJ484_09440 [Oscillospiraceae bacterium]|nr:hypothetical protein [Oscillospiraceae bacterium]